MKTLKAICALTAGLILTFCLRTTDAQAQGTSDGTLLYVGTYTGGKSKGIYAFRLDDKGTLKPLGLVAESINPTFLAIHPNQKFLYAANEIGNFGPKKNAGAVSAFAIDAETGKLTLLNQQSSGGGGPCHLFVDKTGQCLLVANYGGGSIAALPLQRDGNLGEATAFIQHEGSSVNKQRQERPHAHYITTDPENRYVLTCDLGLDKVLVYRLGLGGYASGGILSGENVRPTLAPNDPPSVSVKAGSGPRHLAFHPNGQFTYVINEMGNTLSSYAWDSGKGALREVSTMSTLPEDFQGNNTTAEVEVHPSGRFVYGSNRGHNSIAVFSTNPKTGKLLYVDNQSTQGKNPRHFAIDPSGKYLIAENQDSDSMVVFQIDPTTGRLSPTGQTVEVGKPVCIKFVTAK